MSSVWEPGLGQLGFYGQSPSRYSIQEERRSGGLQEMDGLSLFAPLSQALGEILWEHSFGRALSVLLPLVLLDAH